MKKKTEWKSKAWNPVTGCTKVSAGCAYCYAETMARLFHSMGKEKYRDGFSVRLHEDVLEEPLHKKTPHAFLTCSMGDLFHEDVPFDFIDRILQVAELTPWHRYHLLTKRAERMSEYFGTHPAPGNVWLGVSVENRSVKKRMDILRELQAPVRFLLCEPLLENLGAMNLENIDWVIVGGESGTRARPIQEEWVMSIKAQAERQGAKFFFKRWGTWGSDGMKRNKYANGKRLRGKVYDAIPGV